MTYQECIDTISRSLQVLGSMVENCHAWHGQQALNEMREHVDAAAAYTSWPRAGASGLSWGGFNITGDRKSIDEICRLKHVEGTWQVVEEALRQRIDRLSKENITLLRTQEDLSERAVTFESIIDGLRDRMDQAMRVLG
jgi:hypothetical protein